VGNRRLPSDRGVLRQVVYLAEINDCRKATWGKSLQVFDERRREACQMTLFPEDRPIPVEAINAPCC